MFRSLACLAVVWASVAITNSQEPKKDTARKPWQDNFEELAKDVDKVGARAAKALNKDHEGKAVAWKLKFVGFRKRPDDKLNLEFDLVAYGIVEPKNAKGLDDKAWKRPIIMAFEPHADAVAEFKKLKAGTEVTVQGTFRKAFWVLLNNTRDFAIVEIADVTIAKTKK